MIGKPIALIQVPNQRLFGIQAAARYLGVHEQTLRKLADLGEVRAHRLGARRVFRLEELNRFIDGLPDWYPDADGGPGEERRAHGNQPGQ